MNPNADINSICNILFRKQAQTAGERGLKSLIVSAQLARCLRRKNAGV